MNMIYDGKAKQLFESDVEGTVIIKYKNTLTAGNGAKKETMDGKGQLNFAINNIIFDMLNNKGIPTHFVKVIDDTTLLAKKVEIVPLEVIVRNVAAGSFSAKYGVEEGKALLSPILEYSYKNDDLGDPMINTYHIKALGLATQAELDEIARLAFAINEHMIAMFKNVGVNLIDFKVEFGKLADGTIVLADEISPDSCRLWEEGTNTKLDKDRFRRNLGGVLEGYQDILNRLSK